MKRIKNANGTGSVTKTTKRKPYRVRVTYGLENKEKGIAGLL
ncbi:hypothetical protein [Leptotrichia massiliensis]|nr:hypothetical protein [Leptotrichia massiliensis]